MARFQPMCPAAGLKRLSPEPHSRMSLLRRLKGIITKSPVTKNTGYCSMAESAAIRLHSTLIPSGRLIEGASAKFLVFGLHRLPHCSLLSHYAD
ncbi:hypothetical protein SRHO_G00291620 [Serrasalmus rhombeus]